MKKVLLLVAALVAVSGTVATAQSVKYNPEDHTKKMARSDADIENEKKNTKASTWLDRGKIYYDAAVAPYTALYRGLEESLMPTFFGKDGKKGKGVVANVEYKTITHPGFTAYIDNGVVSFWKVNDAVAENGLDMAYAAYAKAYELDPKVAAKVKSGIQMVAEQYKKDAENYYGLAEYEKTAENFAKAYDALQHPAVNEIDTASAYNAGLFYTYAEKYAQGEKYLKEALKYNYERDGEVYYYLYHCYLGRDMNQQGKDILEEGIRKYPDNTSIVGGLIDVYTLVDGNPADIIPIVEKAIQDEPDNAPLWGGLGGIYLKLSDPEKAVEAYKEAVRLAPNDLGTNLRLGNAYVEYANKKGQELNDNSANLNYDEFNVELEKVNDIYEMSVAPLEKAHQVDPSNFPAVDLLKNITFRLRERDGMQAKFDKYKVLAEEMAE